ncbi:MAG: efflux RND transporter periplasmic adaptor subunit [Vicinamibacteria bacterium]|nr:efflux RND transporter periplasmic adaptor subunit [Vicinamibacteria bacterium]
MNRRRLIAVLLLLVALAAVFSLRRRGPRPTPVEVAAARVQPVFRSFVTASGQVVASRYADLGSSAMGRVVELRVKEGDRVRAGQVLARLDAVPARSDEAAAAAALQALGAEVAAAEARDVEAESAARRAEQLARDGLLPPSQLDAALAARDAARAQLRALRERVAQAEAQRRRAADALSKTEITSPMDGTVTRLAVREGEMVVIGVQNQPGTILMTVSDLATLDAEVKVAEADVLRLKVGQSATVTLEALPGREIPAHVIEVGASALPVVGQGAAAREFRVLLRLDAADAGLKPGLTCDAKILASERKDAITVPLQAVVLRAGEGGAERPGVFVVENDVARFRPVTPGVIGGLDIEVEGLAAGTRLVAGPFTALREMKDGEPLKETAGP